MSVTENKEFVYRYLAVISGQPKTTAVVNEYISEADPGLEQHIVGYEAAFPCYELVAEDMIAEDDKVTVRFSFRGTYRAACRVSRPGARRSIARASSSTASLAARSSSTGWAWTQRQ